MYIFESNGNAGRPYSYNKDLVFPIIKECIAEYPNSGDLAYDYFCEKIDASKFSKRRFKDTAKKVFNHTFQKQLERLRREK